MLWNLCLICGFSGCKTKEKKRWPKTWVGKASYTPLKFNIASERRGLGGYFPFWEGNFSGVILNLAGLEVFFQYIQATCGNFLDVICSRSQLESYFFGGEVGGLWCLNSIPTLELSIQAPRLTLI